MSDFGQEKKTLEKVTNDLGEDSSPGVILDNDLERRGSTIVQGQKWKRIAPPLGRQGSIVEGAENFDGDTAAKMVEMEADNAIKYRSCSWYKTAALLFSEYICLAIMSFPYSYSVLGLVPGIILTVVQAAFVLYTSLIVW